MKTHIVSRLVLVALTLAAFGVAVPRPQPSRAAGPWYVGRGGSEGRETHTLDIVTNGDFEVPVVYGDWVTYYAGQSLDGWTIESGSIEHVGAVGWQAASGVQSVDLSGDGPGTLYQDLSTVAGQGYSLGFSMAGNPYGDPIKEMEILWGSALVAATSFDSTGHSFDDMGWVSHEFFVLATGNVTRLKFRSLNDTPYGPALDNVTVAPTVMGASTKSVSPTTPSAGDSLTFTIVVRNQGSTTITDAAVTDTLPSLLTYISGSLTATSGTYDYDNGVITWNGEVDPGESVTITFEAIVSETAPLDTEIVNSAVITGAGEQVTRTATAVVSLQYVFLPLALRPCTPLFVDYFSDPASGWPDLDAGSTLFQYLNGEYHILLRNPNWSSAATPDYYATDYIVAVDVRNPTGVYGSYGLLFGLEPWSQFYTFEVDPEGNYAIWRYDYYGGGWTLLTSGFFGSLNQGTASNRLKLERNGSLIEAYANDTLLASISDGTFTGSRQIGFIVSSFDQGNLDVYFDAFTVYPTTCDAADVGGPEEQVGRVGPPVGAYFEAHRPQAPGER